jgi:hypothetical protein
VRAKKNKAKQGQALVARPAGGMGIAARWPVHEVLISRGWEDVHALATVLVARRSPNSGKVAAASFLVDLACLGVKGAQVRLHKSVAEYQSGLRAHIVSRQVMEPISFDLAAKIVLTGILYADDLGFKPDPVFAQAAPLLEGADLNADPTPVHTGGPEGKPLFVNGPYDNVDKVIAQLTRAVGAGNFNVLIGSGPDGPMLLSDAEWDDLEDDNGTRRMGV